MRHLAAALALVSLCACAGSYTNGGSDLLPPDGGGGAGTDGGSTDGGSDGGPAQGCAVSITLTSSTAGCTGVANRGTLDAFDGGCSGIPGCSCTSVSLPGTLNCTYGPATCTIR